MSFKIVKKLTPYNFTDKNDVKRIKYIVIHYFGSLGTAEAVANYFANAYRGASAHYSLDEGEIIYQSVEDEDIAWHCGTYGTYYHPDCRNSNSLGIEVRPHKVNTKSMLASDTDWYFKPEIVDRLVEFTKYLMNKYNVPIERVIRHYDVTHKICPNPFVVNAAAQAQWNAFKKRLVDTAKPKPTTQTKPAEYKVRVSATALNIRSGPGTNYKIVGQTGKGVFTIVEKASGAGATKWGKLKSGAGWISLDFVEGAKPVVDTEIKLNDVINFKGGNYFVSSTGSKYYTGKPGKAKVTQIVKGAKYPYHVIRIGNTTSVYGWVTASQISK